jgi:hypothetical protein
LIDQLVVVAETYSFGQHSASQHLLIGLFQQAPMYWGQAFERSAAPRICL